MRHDRKGQINVYFLLSAAIFISMVIYLIYAIANFYPERGESIRINSLYSKAYVLSELMIKDSGSPEGWDENSIMRIGLASPPYKLSREKVSRMQNMCNSSSNDTVERLSKSCGIVDEVLAVNIDYLNGTRVMGCNPFRRDFESAYEKSRFAKITRVATLDGEIVEVTVYVG